MLEFLLLFALGFLCAGLLALMVAPVVWRRSARQARKQFEASLPLSLDEIDAGKGRLRAQSAMTVRRLEMLAASANEKVAAQSIEIGRGQEALKRAEREHEGTRALLLGEKNRSSELEQALSEQADKLAQLLDKHAAAEKLLQERAAEIERLGGLYQETVYASSSRQIELVQRNHDNDRLRAEIAEARERQKTLERRAQDVETELRVAQEATKVERKRGEDRETKIQAMLSILADLEEQLARHDKGSGELREGLRAAVAARDENSLQIAAAHDQNRLLEGRLAVMSEQRVMPKTDPPDVLSAEAAKYAADRRRLEDRLTIVAKQNQKLRAEIAALQVPSAAASSGDQDAMLREQISSIAAQVVHLTRGLEGPGSAIDKALELPQQAPSEGGADPKIVSLAERVRALQKAAGPSTR